MQAMTRPRWRTREAPSPMNRKVTEAAAYRENGPMIKNDRELEQAQAKILICQALLANARRTLPPEAFRRESARRLEGANPAAQAAPPDPTPAPPGAPQPADQEGRPDAQAAPPPGRRPN